MGAVIALLVGLAVGSFLNVCIFRLPEGRSVIWPPSSCSSCGTRLGPRDLVPVGSYVLLRGRCRYCGARISPLYPCVEILTAVLFVGLYSLMGPGMELAKALVLVSVLIVAAFTDLRRMVIPDRLLVFGLVAGILFCFFDGWKQAVIGALAAGAPLLVLALASRGGMGMGDIKLAGLVGFYLGWEKALLGIFMAAVAGALTGGILLAGGRLKRKQPFPFAPFLAGGALVALIWGDAIWWLWWGF